MRARSRPSPRAFQGRLAGLAGAHDLLVDSNWAGTGLRALILAQLSPFLERQDRLKLTGEDVMLPSNAVLTLGMTLHELATNAAKYGALSTDAGTVEVTWRQEPKDDRAGRWCSSGRSAAVPRSRRPSSGASAPS